MLPKKSLAHSEKTVISVIALAWIIQLLPQIAVQLVYYKGDKEFPAAARLLIDPAAVNFLEFEFLAVLATIFVDQLILEMSSCK